MSVVVVEEVNTEKATVIYAWGDSQEWRIAKGNERRTATVLPGDQTEIKFGAFTLRMGGDPNSLIVTRVTPRSVATETFRKTAQ